MTEERQTLSEDGHFIDRQHVVTMIEQFADS